MKEQDRQKLMIQNAEIETDTKQPPPRNVLDKESYKTIRRRPPQEEEEEEEEEEGLVDRRDTQRKCLVL
jgi:hypothetical protein